jgi:hypothetical protein
MMGDRNSYATLNRVSIVWDVIPIDFTTPNRWTV